MKFGVSIIICCHNGEQRIAETIKFLALQQVPANLEWEVIVVDNASRDNTSSTASAAWQQYYRGGRANFKIVNEPEPGLTNARLAGVKSAEAEIIIFCDDDNHFSAYYVSTALQLMNEHPRTGIAGGIAKPTFSVEGREWLKDFFIAMAVGPQNPTDGFVNWVYGAGMVVRKEVFRILERKNIKLLLTDRAGKSLTSGGDCEICILATLLGFDIYYTSKLVLFHNIPARRLEKKYYLKTKMNTVSGLAHLALLNALIRDNALTWQKVYFRLLLDSLRCLGYYFPRAIVGKHRFFSFFSFYQGGQTALWLILNRKEFINMHQSIIDQVQTAK